MLQRITELQITAICNSVYYTVYRTLLRYTRYTDIFNIPPYINSISYPPTSIILSMVEQTYS